MSWGVGIALRFAMYSDTFGPLFPLYVIVKDGCVRLVWPSQPNNRHGRIEEGENELLDGGVEMGEWSFRSSQSNFSLFSDMRPTRKSVEGISRDQEFCSALYAPLIISLQHGDGIG
ncbi:hypothetical protein ACMFMG_012190 [Clarireedia jacksonii]